jgi:hypothetical protein
MKLTTKRKLLVGCAIVAMIGGACTSPSAPSSDSNAAAGTYTLATIDGGGLPAQTVPALAVNGGCVGFTDSATLTLVASGTPSDQTYDLQMRAHFTCPNGPGPNLTASDSGRWTASGNTLTFTSTGNSAGTNLNLGSGMLNGSTLTVAIDAPSYTPNVASTRVNTEWRR